MPEIITSTVSVTPIPDITPAISAAIKMLKMTFTRSKLKMTITITLTSTALNNICLSPSCLFITLPRYHISEVITIN